MICDPLRIAVTTTAGSKRAHPDAEGVYNLTLDDLQWSAQQQDTILQAPQVNLQGGWEGIFLQRNA